MKIMITGISGFIGSYLAKYLQYKGHRVHGIDLIPNSRRLRYYVHTVDLKKPIDTLPDHDLIIHLAGNADVGKSFSDPQFDFDNNVVSTMNLLEYNGSNGNKPIIFMSSYRVYPMQDSQINKYRVDLDGTRSIYGCSKLACEIFLKEYGHLYGTPVVINRLSCVYGEGQKPNKQGWMTLFMYNKINGIPIEISGDGKQIRDCLHIDDLARLVSLQINNLEKCTGHTYDVGGGPRNLFSLIEIIDFLDKEYPQYKPLRDSIKWVPEGKSFRAYITDLSEISWLWLPEISMIEGIKRTMEYLLKS